METPPRYDCFHTFIRFKEYQLRTAYWSRVGNPPLQSNLQLMKECRGILLDFLPPPPPCPSACWHPPNQARLASASFSKHFWWGWLFYFCDMGSLEALDHAVLSWLSTSFRDLILKPKYWKVSVAAQVLDVPRDVDSPVQVAFCGSYLPLPTKPQKQSAGPGRATDVIDHVIPGWEDLTDWSLVSAQHWVMEWRQQSHFRVSTLLQALC